MRRTSLSLLALLLVFACSCRPADHAVSPGPSAGPVVISLTTKPTGVFKFTVAPPSISISISRHDQIEWRVTNTTDFTLTDVHITLLKGDTGKTDPFNNGGTFNVPSVCAGCTVNTPSGTAKPDSQDSYNYIVTGILNSVPISLDPRLVVGD
ncbi:MAG TPA: hypothetical protein VK747_01055 [Blastocatellia bacterium]|nr:hypothetical protein [Blastocatellia bacterium]